VLAVIFMPPTVIASIYGMNFKEMPELEWHLGYPLAIALMICAAIGPYLAGTFHWQGGNFPVVRRRDWLIDKKIGSVIRTRRVKLGLSQSDLGNALRVSFQQIQKYENGTNAVASTRISDLCRALEMTPNDLFGVSSKMDGDVSKLGSWTMRAALKLEDASPATRQAIDAMLNAVPKRWASQLTPAEHSDWIDNPLQHLT
jgi:transcriptional regulator with XRE-family HTH domain